MPGAAPTRNPSLAQYYYSKTAADRMSINSINGLTVEISAGLLASTTSRAVRRPATAYLGETGKEPPKQFVKFVQFVAKTLPKLYCSRTCRTACSRKSALP